MSRAAAAAAQAAAQEPAAADAADDLSSTASHTSDTTSDSPDTAPWDDDSSTDTPLPETSPAGAAKVRFGAAAPTRRAGRPRTSDAPCSAADKSLRCLLAAPFGRVTLHGFGSSGRRWPPSPAVPQQYAYDFSQVHGTQAQQGATTAAAAAASAGGLRTFADLSLRDCRPGSHGACAPSPSGSFAGGDARMPFGHSPASLSRHALEDDTADLFNMSASEIHRRSLRLDDADSARPVSPGPQQGGSAPVTLPGSVTRLRHASTVCAALTEGEASASGQTLQDILQSKIDVAARRESCEGGPGEDVGGVDGGDDSAAASGVGGIEWLRRELANEESGLRKKTGRQALAEGSANEPLGAAIAAAEALQYNDVPFVSESETMMPVSDVHSYLLYCQNHGVSIILRPVADGAAQAFIGTFSLNDPTLLDERGYPILDRTEHAPWSLLSNITKRNSNARGKTMSTSLKSSPYNPIKGCVPVVAQLSKVGAAQTRLKSNLEAALIEAEKMQADDDEDASPTAGGGGGGGGGAAAGEDLKQVYARLKSMEATAVKIFSKIEADSKRAMENSRISLERLMKRYTEESMLATEKRKVSEMYIDEFNNSQFLGECYIRSGPLQEVVHYVGWSPVACTEPWLHHTPYQENALPVFVLVPQPPDTLFRRWDEAKSEFVSYPQGLPENTYPVPVVLVSSRQFCISATGRIEERAEGAMLVPDYDGLSYAPDTLPPPGVAAVLDNSAELERILWEHAEEGLASSVRQRYIPNMGMVSEQDFEHVGEIRSLTDWRQNHGVESNNTVKTQEFLPGNYSCFDSDGRLHIVRNFPEAIQHFRNMWPRGCPVKLNPNWNVLLDSDWHPIVPTDSITPLYDLEGEEASFLSLMKNTATQEWDLPSIKAAYERLYLKDRIEGWTGAPRTREGKKATELETWRAYVKYRDRQKIMQLFFLARTYLLYPPYVLHHKYVDQHKTDTTHHLLLETVGVVRRRLRDHQNKLVLTYARQLSEDRRLFEAKHGLKSTDFIDRLWAYMMVKEITHGFDSREDAQGPVALDMGPEEHDGGTDGVLDTAVGTASRNPAGGASNRTGPIKMLKATDNRYYTPGEMQGIAFMKRVNAVYHFSGHDPWGAEGRNAPINTLARQEPTVYSASASSLEGGAKSAAKPSLARLVSAARSGSTFGRRKSSLVSVARAASSFHRRGSRERTSFAEDGDSPGARGDATLKRERKRSSLPAIEEAFAAMEELQHFAGAQVSPL